MNVLAGLCLGGSIVDPRAPARLGAPAWGPTGLLRDLELRLGAPAIEQPASLRVPRWMERIAALRSEDAFYARSFAGDPLGTAEALLGWRDGLVEAGWDGRSVPGGGDRLDALAVLEAQASATMPAGDADRLVRVERALERRTEPLYASLTLVEGTDLWPGRWRRIFARLEALGTTVTRLARDVSGAPVSTDLGTLQAHLRGSPTSRRITGDGTLLLVRGDTTIDLGEFVASLLARGAREGARSVVVRCLDGEALDAALVRHGLPAQGSARESTWRPVMQVLPLVLELAFAPRDPYRVLELLTLRDGPFGGTLGRALARAVTRQPGVGGKEWSRQKADAAERLRARTSERLRAEGRDEADAAHAAAQVVDARLEDVAAWLEAPALEGAATREQLLAVTARVGEWLRRRMRAEDAAPFGAAYRQVVSFGEAITRDSRDAFTQVEARQLVDRFGRHPEAHASTVEEAGRVAHVRHPSAMLASFDRVVLWSFVAGIEQRPVRGPWNDAELRALERVGVRFVESSTALRADAEAWRGTLLAAKERAVLVIPRTLKGRASMPHPLWDEIRARLRLDDRGEALLTRECRDVLAGTSHPLLPTARLSPLLLPAGRPVWRLAPDALPVAARDDAMSVSALEKVATCPLAWVLEHRARLREGAVAAFGNGPLLYGKLAHRLVEELHADGAFDLAEEPFLRRVTARFEALLPREGATLLLPGASIERLQIGRQIAASMRSLHRYLARAGFKIASVEEVVATEAAIGLLQGRLDLRLVDAEGRAALLDLKWGATQYREQLEKGCAVQLAVYARALGHDVPAGYFALAAGKLLAQDARMKPERAVSGPPLDDTWRRVDATAKAVVATLARGEVPVAGVARALPLLQAVGVGAAERTKHLEPVPDAACGYCAYDAVCGRKWEALT